MYFDGADPDPAMRAAVEQLRGDPRLDSVAPQTRREASEAIILVFAAQPELVQTPGACPD